MPDTCAGYPFMFATLYVATLSSRVLKLLSELTYVFIDPRTDFGAVEPTEPHPATSTKAPPRRGFVSAQHQRGLSVLVVNTARNKISTARNKISTDSNRSGDSSSRSRNSPD